MECLSTYTIRGIINRIIQSTKFCYAYIHLHRLKVRSEWNLEYPTFKLFNSLRLLFNKNI